MSLSGGNVPPTYTQLVFLIADSTAACEMGTLGLAEVLFSDPDGNAISYCGTLDVPCSAAVVRNAKMCRMDVEQRVIERSVLDWYRILLL